MASKTTQAIEAFKSGDIKTALKISSEFRIDVDPYEKRVLKNGYEALVHPKFYIQLGRDINRMIEDAKDLFVVKFMKEVA